MAVGVAKPGALSAPRPTPRVLSPSFTPSVHTAGGGADGAADDDDDDDDDDDNDRESTKQQSAAAFSRQLQWAAFASGVAERLGEEEQAERTRRRQWAVEAARSEAERSRLLTDLSSDVERWAAREHRRLQPLQAHVWRALQGVKAAAQELWPAARVELFGSWASGLHLAWCEDQRRPAARRAPRAVTCWAVPPPCRAPISLVGCRPARVLLAPLIASDCFSQVGCRPARVLLAPLIASDCFSQVGCRPARMRCADEPLCGGGPPRPSRSDGGPAVARTTQAHRDGACAGHQGGHDHPRPRECSLPGLVPASGHFGRVAYPHRCVGTPQPGHRAVERPVERPAPRRLTAPH